MASVSFTQFSMVPRICRWHLNGNITHCMNLVKIQDYRVNKKVLMAVSRKNSADSSALEVSDVGEAGIVEEKTPKTRKRASPRTRKKDTEDVDQISSASTNAGDEEILTTSPEIEKPKKTRRTRRKAAPSTPETSEAGDPQPVDMSTSRRGAKKKKPYSKVSETEFTDLELNPFSPPSDEEDIDQQDPELNIIDDGEDISFTYGWPPLVCCFGAAQHAFVPAGRQANRLINHEIHERMKDAFWQPEKFVRSPGGCSSNVAVALASLGGKVAFMGKLGDDAYGQSLLYYLNTNNVQTRSVRIDENQATALSRMKVDGRGGLRVAGIKPCAEDCLLGSEINVDVLKEAKMFYFNTFSLLDRNMRSTTMRAVKIAKQFGNVIFYDLNLPMPLWQSSEETKAFVKRAWYASNIIEVTKQELEFLCGISPSEKFDTKDNDKSKFTHYSSEIVSRIWHEDLVALFVTNGTSKIHYYTKEFDGFVHGMEDAPITPYTSDMSASGDGIVAGLLRMLAIQPHLISNKGHLERAIRYAINCGVIDQWLMARKLGNPAKEGMEDVKADPHGIRSITEKEYRTIPSRL